MGTEMESLIYTNLMFGGVSESLALEISSGIYTTIQGQIKWHQSLTNHIGCRF